MARILSIRRGIGALLSPVAGRLGKTVGAGVLVPLLMVAGCASPVPVAQTWPLHFQQKIQSAHHWNVLAGHVAGELGAWLPGSGWQGRPIMLTSRDGGDFGRAFGSLLATSLHEQGFAVATRPVQDGFTIAYEAQVVEHKGKAFVPKPGTFTLLGSGVAVAGAVRDGVISSPIGMGAAAGAGMVADFASGYVTGETDTEVIVTVTAADHNLLAFRRSFVFYINDADAAQYAGSRGADVVVPLGSGPDAEKDAWRTADARCQDSKRGKAMLRGNTPTREGRELRFECIDLW